jgi:hypothetical protein
VLKQARKLAIRDELFTMRLRGVLTVVPPVVVKAAKKPDEKG